MDKEFIKAARLFIEQVPILVDCQVAIARLQKARYDALIKEGFTEQQAVQLCQNVIGGQG